MNNEIRRTLEALKNGELSVDDALLAIKKQPFEDIGYAKVDLHRGIRQGAAEVIYGAGKTWEQMAGIIETMQKSHVNYEMHIYPSGCHGLSLATEETAGNREYLLEPACQSWVLMVQSWIENQRWKKR